MKEKDFRRQTGVKIKTYEKMVEIVTEAHVAKKERGRKNVVISKKLYHSPKFRIKTQKDV